MEEIDIEQLLKIFSLIIIFINFFILITICLMHIRQISIREGYFYIIFTQIIFESLFNLTSIISIIISLIFKDNNNKIFFIISLCFNFFYNIDIIYNIQTILYLIKAKNKVDSEDVYSNNFDLSRSEDYNKSGSIDLKKHSFRRIHFISFFFTLLQSFIYSMLYFGMNKEEDMINKEKLLKWYFYFIGNGNLFYIIIFILNYFFVFFSFRYCCLKQKINGSIKLKNYSIYCFLSSITGLMFPSKVIINKILSKEKLDNNIFDIIYSILFLFYLIIISYFRVNCYYVQYILSKKSKNFCSKLKFGLKILFMNEKVPSPNFIDFNNSFIYHSLSSEKDFSFNEEKILLRNTINDDLNNSESFSFSFKNK